MTTRQFLAIILITATAASTAVAKPAKKSILSLKESITDNNITYPASFETNTQKMMQNWYLQNYAVIDTLVEKRDINDVSDDEYVRRLKAIPSAIELPYNQIVHSYILRYIKDDRTLVSQMLGMSPYYMPIFEQALEREGLPLELKYIPVIESALDPNAVSSAGAGGLWQLMVQTAKDLGLEVNTLVDERRDPYRSSAKAAAYFKQLYGIYGDWSLAIAAYNCGPGNVNKAIRRAKGRDVQDKTDFWEIYNYLPRETRGYVPAFIAANYVMTHYQKHNINPSLAKKPLLIDTVQVHHRVNFNQISQVLNIPLDEIRILNPQYRHDVIPGDTHAYTLALPSQQIYSFILVEDSIAGYRPDLYAQREVVQPGQSPADHATGVAYDVSNTSTISAQPASTPANSGTEGETTYHKVRRGETLKSIAADWGMTTDQLMALNGLKRSKVRRGQVLKVRRGAAQQTKPDTKQNDVAEAVASVPQKHADTSEETLLAQTAPAGSAAQKGDFKTTDGSYTPYKGSYSIDDEVDQERASQRRAAQQQRERTQQAKQDGQKEVKKESRPESKKETKKETKKADDFEYYEVQRGESLRSIADDHGISVAKLKSVSGISSSAELIAGQKIKVPAGTNATQKTKADKKRKSEKETAKAVTHTVKKGESVWDIAHDYGVTVGALRRANGIKGNDIKAGQKLTIPEGGKQEAGSSSKGKKSKKSSKKKAQTQTYVVKPGDSMERVSRRTGISVKELEEITGINNKTIRAGQTFTLPKK